MHLTKGFLFHFSLSTFQPPSTGFHTCWLENKKKILLYFISLIMHYSLVNTKGKFALSGQKNAFKSGLIFFLMENNEWDLQNKLRAFLSLRLY